MISQHPTLTRLAAILAAAILILFSTSCSNDDISAPNTGEVMVTFSFSLPDNASAMRALTDVEDKAIKTVEVLAFDKDGNFSYASYATPEAGQSSVTVGLVKSDNDEDKYDLVVLANSRLEVMTAAQQFTKGTTTKATALDALTRTVEGKWRAMNGADKDFIPVSSDPEDTTLKGLEITEGRSFSSVNLYRALALVNVELNSAAQTTFKLTGVRVYNRNKQGNLIGGRNASDKYTKAPNAIGSSRTSDPILYGSDTGTQTSEITNDKSCSNEIFLFEVANADWSIPYDTRPCIVISGLYNGSSIPTYYRADFHDGTDYLDILRNHNYTFTITGVNIDGYPTPQDAFNAQAVNIEYTVDAWEDTTLAENDYIKQYSLVPSSAKFAFDAAARDQNNGDNILTVETDQAGWTAEIEYINDADNAWLSLIDFAGASATFPATTGSSIKLKLDPNNSGTSRSAIINLTAGKAIYPVRVEQSEVVNRDKLYPSEAASYTIFTVSPFNKIFIPVSRANAYPNTDIKLGNSDVFTVGWEATPPANSSIIKEVKPIGIGSAGHVYIETGTGSGEAEVFIKKGNDEICRWDIIVKGVEPEANCYIVSPNNGSTLLIPVSQLYRAMEGYSEYGSAPADAALPSNWAASDTEFAPELVWQDTATSDLELTTSVVGGNGPNAYLKVQVTKAPTEGGNAVVGIRKKNASTGQAEGGFLWSWHIWVTDYKPISTGTNVKLLMDRNLGALNNGFVDRNGDGNGDIDASSNENISSNIQTYGLLYQWGRKDPFPGSNAVDASGASAEPSLHTTNPNYYTAAKTLKKVSVASATTITPTSDNNTTYAPMAGAPENLGYAVANPHIFYWNSSSPYDWYTTNSSNQNNNLWGNTTSTKTVYDPCPPGWKVPRSGGYTNGATATLSSANDAVAAGWNWYEISSTPSVVGGYRVTTGTYSYSPAWFPAAGYRSSSSGNFSNVGSSGYCWLSAVYSSYGRRLSFYASNVNPNNNNNRANGYSLRCLQESSE